MTGGKVLVVDDEPSILELSWKVLAKEGYSITTAHSGCEALKRAKGEKFDLLVTDIIMPEMDGLELLQRLRELYPDIAAVIITGYGTMENAINSLKQGAQGFIVKPFTPDELKIALSQVLEKSRLMRENSRLRVLRPLFDISKSLISETKLSELLSHTVDTLVEETKADMVSLMLLDKETQEPSIRVSHGFPKEMLVTARWVAERGEPLLLPDMEHAEPHIQGELSESAIGPALCLPLLVKGKVSGVLTLAKLAGKEPFRQSDLELLSMLCNQLAIVIENIKLFDKLTTHKQELERTCKELGEQATALNDKKQQLESAYLEIAKTLALTLEACDPYTRGHSERVVQFARQIALQINLSRKERELIDIAARLHDIGKLAIRNEILLKPDVLTPSERAEVQRHPTKAVEMLRFLDFLKGALPIIEHHHERYDGKGYPSGLKGEQIPLGARILAVADAYDALTSERPYRPAMSNEQAMETLKQGAGTRWDPIVVEAFLSALEQNSAKRQTNQDNTHG